jgi:hypothetical protein
MFSALFFRMKRIISILLTLLCFTSLEAQTRFVYLTTEEVQIDSVIPHTGYSMALPEGWQDSVYTVTLAYPEYIDMPPSDIEAYKRLSGAELPAIPELETTIVHDRKKPFLKTSLVPIAFVDGKYKWVVSFMLRIEAKPMTAAKAKAMRKVSGAAEYAEHSVLSTGSWAKIRVNDTGIFELTDAVIKKAGFTDINKVKIYGYGGNLQPEKISHQYLTRTDDLKEVEQCIIGGRHLFYGRGPVSWASNTAVTRIRNPYSDYGYYFITQSDDPVLTVDSAAFVSSFYHSEEDYHSLYEKDGFAWYSGGRNLVDNKAIPEGQSQTITIANDTGSTSGRMYINVSAGSATKVELAVNDSVVGTLTMSVGEYDKGAAAYKYVTLNALKAENSVKITTLKGGPARLDYIALAYSQPRENYRLTAPHPAAEYVYNITNQDLHADSFADMVIIIPTSQKLRPQAERLKKFHEERDGMRVNIVPADELYNEFSSGTPDANAYRRYLKMLYDKAQTEEDMPKYLVLFGDCVWDNRMLTATTRNLNPDDYLLCFESENSYNEIYCYIDDGWFCLLDEGEGDNPQSADLLDMAVGRFPVTTDAEAKIMVDKTIAYAENKNAGAWQNTIMFLGDDGNNNLHMDDVNDAANETAANHPGFLIKKVMWDSFERVMTSNGATYPEVTKLVKAQQQAGALIIDYAGHGSETQISHERVLNLNDFAEFTNTNLPLWITASCDIMPFDGTFPTIGEAAVLNSKGGAFAFFGTTRTVYASYNKRINMAFLRYALNRVDGKPTTIGEAQRLAKNFLITSSQDRTTNKLQFSLLGDPAIALNIPEPRIVIDSINGAEVGGGQMPMLKAGSTATIIGHVADGSDFNGVVTATVRDSEQEITCRLNDTSQAGAQKAFVYKDRTKTIFHGSDYVKNGKFNISFAVPMDISYSEDNGLINLFAVNDDKTVTVHGSCSDFNVGGTESLGTDSIGPSIFCYLNSPDFVDGGQVNSTPYFVAEITDDDGINTSGAGIGHDLMLIIDGSMDKTYNLNGNFVYDFGSHTKGTTFFSIPPLEDGPHKLQFRAWDIFNNSSVTTLRFNVVNGSKPSITDIGCTDNPARTTTTFIISHNRMGSSVEVLVDVMDMTGRVLWTYAGHSSDNTGSCTVDWNLTDSRGNDIQTGVYLYRARIACEDSKFVSKTKKLIIIR